MISVYYDSAEKVDEFISLMNDSVNYHIHDNCQYFYKESMF